MIRNRVSKISNQSNIQTYWSFLINFCDKCALYLIAHVLSFESNLVQVLLFKE